MLYHSIILMPILYQVTQGIKYCHFRERLFHSEMNTVAFWWDLLFTADWDDIKAASMSSQHGEGCKHHYSAIYASWSIKHLAIQPRFILLLRWILPRKYFKQMHFATIVLLPQGMCKIVTALTYLHLFRRKYLGRSFQVPDFTRALIEGLVRTISQISFSLVITISFISETHCC